MRYYYPDGDLIDRGKSEEEKKRSFIDFYSQLYYYINRNNGLENDIEKRLHDATEGKVLGEKALEEILRWKVDMRFFTFTKEETDKNNKKSKIYISLNDILKVTRGISLDTTDDMIPNILKELMDCDGIGPVYAIAILYFCTGGKYPLYDKYAHIALMTIMERRDFNLLVTEKERERKFHFSTRNIEMLSSDYNSYKILLKDWLEGMEYNRKVDQALWTYGHLFDENKSNRSRHA